MLQGEILISTFHSLKYITLAFLWLKNHAHIQSSMHKQEWKGIPVQKKDL